MSQHRKRKHRGVTTPRRSARADPRDTRPAAPLQPNRHPLSDPKGMATHFSNAQTVTDFLRAELVELRRSGAGVEQVVKLLNAGADPVDMISIIENTLEEFSAAMGKHTQRLGEFKQLLLLERQASD